MSDNSAVIKIVAKHTKEYNALLLQHNTLLKVHVKTVEEFAESESKNYELRKLLKQWKKENETLQESLDQCQRDVEELMGI